MEMKVKQKSLLSSTKQTQSPPRWSKKSQGHSQFIKSKFDVDYDPKYRVIKETNAFLKHNEAQTKDGASILSKQMQILKSKAQQQVRKGKKLVIDWNLQDTFRSTKFPCIQDKFLYSRRSNTEAIHNNIDTPKNIKYLDYLQKFKSNDKYKQIAQRGLYLKDVISAHASSAKHKIKLRKPKSNFRQNHQIQEPGILKRQKSMAGQLQEKKKEFYQKNNQKILEAIQCEQKLHQSIAVSSGPSPKKLKIEDIQKRIICKSKLTLLKSELGKKFKQIRDNIMDDYSRQQNRSLF